MMIFQRLIAIVLTMMIAWGVLAQDETASMSTDFEPSDFGMRVVVDSLNIRALPTTESDRVGSVFEGDVLYAVGRNVDATWFEVQRPMREVHVGWVSREFFSYMFDPTLLPITDLVTGVTGDEPVVDTGVSVFVITEAAFRDAPNLDAGRIGIVPIQVTIPVIERSPDNNWLRVNYLGQTGWLAEFLVRIPVGINDIPIAEEFLNVSLLPIEIIPIEVQRAQANRLLNYATPIKTVSEEVAVFWSQLTEGLTIPCNPPASSYTSFEVTQEDLYELPELRGASHLIPIAITDLNTSIEVMSSCAVFTPTQISGAYADAINANAILGNSINQMNYVLEFTLGE
jgi:hypothetical protein